MTPPPSSSTGWSLLRRRSFGPYLAGNLISNCGTWIQNLALAVLVFRRTESTLLVGVVGFTQFGGVLLFLPWTGSVVDRFDTRKIIIVTQTAMAVSSFGLGLLALAGGISIPVVIGIAFLGSIANAFYLPAQSVIIPQLVEPHEMRPAVAFNSFTFAAGRAVGPLIGALLIEISMGVAFLVNSLTFVALIGALFISKPIHHLEKRDAPSSGFRAGLAVVRASHVLGLLLLAVTAIAIANDPVVTLAPQYSQDLLGEPAAFAGVLGGAFGAGSLIALLILARRTAAGDGPIAKVLLGLGVTGIAFALAPNAPLALVALMGMGICFSLANVLTQTSLQVHSPAAVRGRVMALWTVAYLGVRPVAALADGGIAALAGLRVAAVIMVLPALAVGLLLWKRLGRHAAMPA